MPIAIPLPWRKRLPLHQKLGVRAMRFYYPAGNNAPVGAANAASTLQLRYDPTTAIDRIIGFNFSVQQQNSAFTFQMQELNTFWQFSYTYSQNRGLFVAGNVETLPDEVNLQWYFSAAPTG